MPRNPLKSCKFSSLGFIHAYQKTPCLIRQGSYHGVHYIIIFFETGSASSQTYFYGIITYVIFFKQHRYIEYEKIKKENKTFFSAGATPLCIRLLTASGSYLVHSLTRGRSNGSGSNRRDLKY